MKKRPYAVNQALEFIRAQAAQSAGTEHKMLPTLDEMARMSGISQRTLGKARDILRKESLIAPQSRRFYRVCADEKIPPSAIEQGRSVSIAPDSKGSGWQRLTAQIEKDILTGRFSQTLQLPTIKELESMYQASYPTVKKALAYLCEKGLIKMGLRGYNLQQPSKRRMPYKVFLFGAPQDGEFLHMGMYEEQILFALEAELARAGISLHIWTFTETDNGLQFTNPATLETISRLPVDETVFGFIKIINVPHGYSQSLMQQLSSFRRPIALLDEIGMWKLEDSIAGAPFVQIFNVTLSQKPGEQIARYLLAKGHTKIAFMAASPEFAWSKIRYNAIAKTYQSAGFTDCVRYYELTSSAAEKNIEQKYTLPMLKDLQHTASRHPQRVQREMKELLNIHLYPVNKAISMRPRLEQLLRELMSEGEVTAIVFAESCATMTVDYCRRKGIRIPNDISIISFDDSIERLRYRITSYNFNISGTVTAVINFILQRGMFGRKQSPQIFEVDGFVVERESVGIAPIRKRKPSAS